MLICRLCGDIFETSSKPGILLYREAAGKILLEEIQQLLSIKIFEDDPLPKYVCFACKSKLDAFVEFRNCTQESQMSLWKNFIAKGSSGFEDRNEYRKWATFRHPIVDHWLLEMILNGTRIDRIDPVVKHRIWKLYRALWKKKVKNTGDEENDVLLKLAATPVVLIKDLKSSCNDKYRKLLEDHCIKSESGKQKLLSETVNRLKSLRMYRAVRGLNNDWSRYREDSVSPPPIKRPRRGASRVLTYDDDFDDDLEYLEDSDSYKSSKTSSDHGSVAKSKTDIRPDNNNRSKGKSSTSVSDLENVLPAYNIPLDKTETENDAQKMSVSEENDSENRPQFLLSGGNITPSTDTSKHKLMNEGAVSKSGGSSLKKHNFHQKTSSKTVQEEVQKHHVTKGKNPNILRKSNCSNKKVSSTPKATTQDLASIGKLSNTSERSNYLDIFKTSLERKTSNDGGPSMSLLHEELNLVPELDITCDDGNSGYVEDPVIKEVEKAVLELTKTMTNADHRNQSTNENSMNDDPLCVTDEQIIEAQDMLMNNEADPLALDTLPLEAFETANDQVTTAVPQVVPSVPSLEKNSSAVGRVQTTTASTFPSVSSNLKFVVNQANPQPIIISKKVTPAPTMLLENALSKPQKSVKSVASNPPTKPQQSLTLDQQIEGILVQILNKPSQSGNTGTTAKLTSKSVSVPSPATTPLPQPSKTGTPTVMKKCPPAIPIDNLPKPAEKPIQPSVPPRPTIRVRNFSTLTANGNTNKTTENGATKQATQNTNNFQSIISVSNPIYTSSVTSSTKSTTVPTTTASSTAFHLQMNNVRLAPPNVTVRPGMQNVTHQKNINTVHVAPGLIQSNINTVRVVPSNVNTVQVVQPTLTSVTPSGVQPVSLNALSQPRSIVLPQQAPMQIVQPEPVVSVSSHLRSPVSYVNVQQSTGTLTGYSATNIASNQGFYQNFSNSSLPQSSAISSTNPSYTAYVQNPGQAFQSNSNSSVIVTQADFRTLTKPASNVTKTNSGSPNTSLVRSKISTLDGRIGYVKDSPNSLAYVPVLLTGGINTTCSVTPIQNSLSSKSYTTPISTSATVSSSVQSADPTAINYINTYRGKHLCICCCAIFDSLLDCRNHVQVHLPHNHAFCHVCGIRMKDLSTLKHHVELCLQEQSPSTEKFYCIFCKMSFASKFGMMYHKCNMARIV